MAARRGISVVTAAALLNACAPVPSYVGNRLDLALVRGAWDGQASCSDGLRSVSLVVLGGYGSIDLWGIGFYRASGGSPGAEGAIWSVRSDYSGGNQALVPAQWIKPVATRDPVGFAGNVTVDGSYAGAAISPYCGGFRLTRSFQVTPQDVIDFDRDPAYLVAMLREGMRREEAERQRSYVSAPGYVVTPPPYAERSPSPPAAALPTYSAPVAPDPATSGGNDSGGLSTGQKVVLGAVGVAVACWVFSCLSGASRSSGSDPAQNASGGFDANDAMIRQQNRD